jgi:hypothetical protein
LTYSTLRGPVYKTEINGRGNSLRSPRNTLYPQKMALTSSTSGDHSVGIVRLRTKASEFSLVFSRLRGLLLVGYCNHEYRGSMLLQNVSKLLSEYTMLRPRRQYSLQQTILKNVSVTPNTDIIFKYHYLPITNAMLVTAILGQYYTVSHI